MPTITAKYLGDLRVECQHVASKNVIITDAPCDNCGKGEAFSPTDLCCAALASCAMTIMAIRAKTWGKEIKATMDITKTMAANPRLIGNIAIVFHIYGFFTEEQKRELENAATSCPVCLSLGANTTQEMKFDWISE